MFLPLSLDLNLVVENRFNSLLFKLLAHLVIFVVQVIIVFGGVCKRDYFAHFADDSVEVDEAVSKHANLEVVAHWPKQPV